MDEVTRRRLERNEDVFRSVNEEIDAREERSTHAYVCECASRDCTERVRLTHTQYTSVRSGSRRFLVVPGHERRELERVVERHVDYFVVEKS